MKIKNFTIGSDFELPVVDENGNFINVESRLGGTKDEPLSIGKGCFRQEDNVNAEFNIPPVKSYEDFEKYINYCIEEGNKILSNQGLKLHIASSARYKEDQIKSEQACTFGCTPSMNAYSLKQQRPPRLPDDMQNLRTAGFHIHVGFVPDEEVSIEDICEVIHYFDMHVGLPSVLIDTDVNRRKLYGKAGEFRVRQIKDTVIFEYRVLGSGMMEDLRLVWECVNNAINAYNNKDKHPGGRIQHIINEDDASKAWEICEDYGVSYAITFQNKKEKVNVT